MVKKGEARQMTRLLEQELRLGNWHHVEFDWTEAVRTAWELSAEHSLKMIVRGIDLFRIAIAIEVAADFFVSFDDDQCALAQETGLPLLPAPPSETVKNAGILHAILGKYVPISHCQQSTC